MEPTTRLACPHCLGDLVAGESGGRCLGCAASFRALRGILDLRTQDDAYLPNREDWAIALRLDEEFDRLDFRGLLDRYFDLAGEVPADLRRRQVHHILSAPDRARQWLDALGPLDEDSPLLDLGCGTGSFLAVAGRAGRETWGLDIAMRWLLVTRKRLDEEGLGHVRLACGCAEGLPFRDRTFSAIVGGDVIEHVADQSATLEEAHRVLGPGGRVFLASPNRFSLAPEPHVQVWGVGFLPRGWMAPYVRWRRRVEFRAIRTMGLGEWRRLLVRSPFGGGALRAPGLPEGDFAHFGPVKRSLARVYNRVVSCPVGQALALRGGPLFHVVCIRPEDSSAPTPNPATRRRSTPLAMRG
jgi:SAM-dependent methyltransferase